MIHRMNSNGRPLCGLAEGNCTTADIMVTCPDCKDMKTLLSNAQAWDKLKKAAERFRL